MESVYCRYCYKDIEEQDELVTATNFFRIRPYHFLCFQEVEQETIATVRSWKPLNGPAGNITIIVMLLLAAVMTFTNLLGEVGNLIGVFALYPILIRVLSFFIFEIRVPSKKKK